jgi:hypothetical protein
VVSATGTYAAAAAKYPELSGHVVEKLALHDVFRGEFLRGISLPTSKLYQLNVDAETSSALKQIVAQFLDVPTGKRLTLYHRCQLTLQDCTNTSTGTPAYAATSPELPDLPLRFLGLRASLRGTTVPDNAHLDLNLLLGVPRAANMRFDDGLPFLMLRMEQQRVAQDQNRLAQVMRMERDFLDVQAAADMPDAPAMPPRNILDRIPMPAQRDVEAEPLPVLRVAARQGFFRDAVRPGPRAMPQPARGVEAQPAPPQFLFAAEPEPPRPPAFDMERARARRPFAGPDRLAPRLVRRMPDLGAAGMPEERAIVEFFGEFGDDEFFEQLRDDEFDF